MLESPIAKSDVLVAAPSIQMELGLYSIKKTEVDGIAMGVLSDGTAYLTVTGLARMCGVDSNDLTILARDWDIVKTGPDESRISELLASHGHSSNSLCRKIQNGPEVIYAYTDAVCMALLEYHAFECSTGTNKVAIKHYRLLARHSLRSFIYNRCGYDPDKHIPDSWRNFHERVLLNDQVPIGFFSVFREIADLVVHLIQGGCPIDDHTVPDVSVGKMWASYWLDNKLSEQFGERKIHPHCYPEWFPQSYANPVATFIYPAGALGVFRVWLYENYIPINFPAYINRKVKMGIFMVSQAELLIAAVSRTEVAGHAQLKD